MSKLTPQSRLSRDKDLIATSLDGDLVMMSIESGQYFGIGGTGVRIWELLEQPRTLQELAAIISSEFEIDESSCLGDMLAFADDLLAKGVATAV